MRKAPTRSSASYWLGSDIPVADYALRLRRPQLEFNNLASMATDEQLVLGIDSDLFYFREFSFALSSLFETLSTLVEAYNMIPGRDPNNS